MERRYEKHLSDHRRWRIVYASTGETVTLEGQPLDDLDEHEADKAIALLEAGELVPDFSEGP